MNYITFTEQFNILIESDPVYHNAPLETIAAAIGSSHQTVSNLITGKTPSPRLSTVRSICEAFNITLDYFMSDTVDDCQQYLRQIWRQTPDTLELDQKVQALSESNQDKLSHILDVLIHASSKT